MNKRILHIHVMRKYWKEARDGKKKEEYRKYSFYWSSRLVDREYDEIHYHLGYPKKGDTSKTIIYPWNGCKEGWVTHPILGPIREYCFIIPIIHKSKSSGKSR